MESLMKIKTIIIAITFALLAETHAQVPTTTCPDVSVVQNFNTTAYLGKWYEILTYPFFYEIDGKCISAEYSLNDNGTIYVVNKGIGRETLHPHSIEGIATQSSTTGEAKFKIYFPDSEIGGDGDYWVLGTDYDSYAVAWSCYKWIGKNSLGAWIFTRDRTPSEEVVNAALKVLEDQKLDTEPLVKTPQTHCPE